MAEVVLGWPVKIPVHHPEDDGAWQCIETGMKGWGVLWHFSTNITAAWEVVGRMNRQWWRLNFSGDMYLVDFSNELSRNKGFADTAPLAICRAALKAVGNE